VFDAAEDGQALVLFDEADSLFAKRTEVKSSVDRYANLEVNYLLQRLDTFEGVAILTTNLEGSIDRRSSGACRSGSPSRSPTRRCASGCGPRTSRRRCRPSATSTSPTSRAASRCRAATSEQRAAAAFLAAQEGRPLCQEHLLRAITLEYRESASSPPAGAIE
jgi:vesicle-fusing ATPase